MRFLARRHLLSNEMWPSVWITNYPSRQLPLSCARLLYQPRRLYLIDVFITVHITVRQVKYCLGDGTKTTKRWTSPPTESTLVLDDPDRHGEWVDCVLWDESGSAFEKLGERVCSIREFQFLDGQAQKACLCDAKWQIDGSHRSCSL